MPTSHFLSSRAPLVAGAIAFAIGAAAVLYAHGGTGPSADVPAAFVAPAPATPVMPVDAVPAPSEIAPTLPAPVAATPAAPALDPAEDPYAGAIVEPVDPAEALFGDHAAVAVSN